MSVSDKIELEKLLDAKIDLIRSTRHKQYFRDTGPTRRELYPKSLAFFSAATRERCFMAANRCSKTLSGAYELTLHLTGDYPIWWAGKRFDKPIKAWACGDTGKSVREILQQELLGSPGEWGTGMIPKANIYRVLKGSGVADSVELVYVKHKSGRLSQLIFKSYDQRRQAFQGTAQDYIWLDEEPPEDIYAECLLRTMTTNGMIAMTFTPLLGVSNVVLAYMPDDGSPLPDHKSLITATWDDVPHLDESAKQQMLAGIPPYQRDARSKGTPYLGAGLIYQVSEDNISVEDFAIPDHWPRAYAMDVGWKVTAALWGALDPATGVIYLYSEYYREQAEPVIHADGIRSRGEWIKGLIDSSSGQSTQIDGRALIDMYAQLGLNVSYPDKSIEVGLYRTWGGLSTGKLKIFKSLRKFFGEYRVYRRNDKGKIVKANDHLMDCMRYFVMSGADVLGKKPVAGRGNDDDELLYRRNSGGDASWMLR